MSITADTDLGRISILAEQGYKRTYQWSSCRKSVILWARPKRWYGSLGIYYPGPGITWWIPCKGVNRAVVDEGQLHFTSLHNALSWIERHNAMKSLDLAYTNTGLVVQWGIEPRRDQISVDVWQLCIAGRTPTELDGADDNSIVVRFANNQGRALGCTEPESGAPDHAIRQHQEEQARIEQLRLLKKEHMGNTEQ